MPGRVDLRRLKRRSTEFIAVAMNTISVADGHNYDQTVRRWMCQMVAVELHAIWERFAEDRLVTCLNHSPKHFLTAHKVKGIQNVPMGLAIFIVRAGGSFFNFRSTSELISRADHLLGRNNNPFRDITVSDRNYIDALAAIRNCIVHGSDASYSSYTRHLRDLYNIHSTP